MDGSNNLTICDYNGNVGLSCGIVCVGQVNGLSSITSNSYKEYAGKSAAIPGYGYIFYDRGNQYYRLFVENYIENTTGGIMGATIKYQQWNSNSQ